MCFSYRSSTCTDPQTQTPKRERVLIHTNEAFFAGREVSIYLFIHFDKNNPVKLKNVNLLNREKVTPKTSFGPPRRSGHTLTSAEECLFLFGGCIYDDGFERGESKNQDE